MSLLKNLKISVKLLGSFFILIAAMVVIGVMGISNMNTLNGYSQKIYYENFQATISLEEVKSNINQIASNVNRALNPNYSNLVHASISSIDFLASTNNEILELYEEIIVSETATANFARLMEILAEFRAVRADLLDLIVAGDYTAAGQLNDNRFVPVLASIRNQVNTMIDYEKEDAEKMLAAAELAYTAASATTTIIIIVMVVFAFALGIIISLNVSGSLKKAGTVTSSIAEGDLTATVPENLLKQKEFFYNTQDYALTKNAPCIIKKINVLIKFF